MKKREEKIMKQSGDLPLTVNLHRRRIVREGV